MYALSLTQAYCPAQTDGEVQETTVGGILRAAAAAWPDAVALDEADASGTLRRRWTFRELLADAQELAYELSSRYRPGERIAIWAPNIPEWVLLEFAAALSGLTIVTVNPAYRARELKFALEQSQAVGLFLVAVFRGNPMADIAAEVAASLPLLREIVDISGRDALFARRGPPGPLPVVRPGDAAQIQYTSGTTGFPKGALLTHRGLTNNARLMFERGGVHQGQTVLNFMPMFHTSGCGAMTLGPVQLGCRAILVMQFDPAHINAIVEAEQVDVFIGVPTMLTALMEAQASQPRDLSSVKGIISGGAMVPPEVIKQVLQVYGCSFGTVYGQTESSPVLTQTRADDPIADLRETVGQPLPHTEVSIRDPETNQVAALDTVGEICARGYALMLGYNDNPAATRAAIDDQGWLHTGDLGCMDSRGFVRVTGRVKEMIIRGGENLFPAEIENVILEHAGVAEVAVVGIPDLRWGEVVACFVRPATGVKLDRAGLIQHCRAQLSGPKTPTAWIQVDDWPLTGSGKIQKFALRDQFVAGSLREM